MRERKQVVRRKVLFCKVSDGNFASTLEFNQTQTEIGRPSRKASMRRRAPSETDDARQCLACCFHAFNHHLALLGLSSSAAFIMSYTPTSYYGHSVKDRTSEFHGLVESIASRSTQPAKQKLLNSHAPGASPKGEFARRAQAIGKDIASTTAKLQRLAQCMCPFTIL